MSFSQRAMATVATQLPIRLVSARPMPMNQSTASTSTRPTTGIAGIAVSVAARITSAEPGIPCAPLEVINDTKRIVNRSVIASGVPVALAINTMARVR
ncbi:hypothetical protein D3C87_1892050 [compost metagenome]